MRLTRLFEHGEKVQELATGLWGTVEWQNTRYPKFVFETQQGGRQTKTLLASNFIPYNGVLRPQDAPFPEGSYSEELRAGLLSYPSLYVDETDVLEHLFFVNGNGYMWKDGRLVPSYDTTLAGRLEQSYNQRLDSRESRRQSRLEFNQLCEEMGVAAQRTELDDEDATSDDPEIQRAYWNRRRRPSSERVLYPLCRYTKIVNLPLDIRPDWLVAAKKALEVVAPNLLRTKEDDKYLDYAKKLIEYIEEREKGYNVLRTQLEELENGS